MTRATSAALAAMLVCAAGCTAIVRVTPTACDTATFCDPLNARDHVDIATACSLWQCHRAPGAAAGTCVRRARDRDDDGSIAVICGGDDCDDARADRNPQLAELCDGVDNDCDLVIDDDADFLPVELARAPTGAAGAAFIDGVAFTVSGGTGSTASMIALPPAGGFGTSSAVTTQSETATIAGPQPPLCLADGSCSVFELAAAAPATGEPILAAITHDLCARGGLLLGRLLPGGGEMQIAGRSTTPVASTSTVFPSVEHTSLDSFCTGTVGATAPAVSVLEGPGVRGLLTWIADSSETRGCPGGGADLRMLGFAVLPRNGTSMEFVLATDDGVAVPLASTTLCGAPAVRAVGASGWLVALAAGTSVEIHFVPAFSMPPPEPPEAPSPPLPDPILVGSIASAVTDVSLAVGGSGAGTEVALAFSDGLAVSFVSFAFDPAAPGASRFPAPTAIGAGARPSVARASTFSSPDDTTVHGQAWLVAFEGGGGLEVGRVRDGSLLESPYVVAPTGSEPALVVRADRTDLFARDGTDLVQLATSCPALPAP